MKLKVLCILCILCLVSTKKVLFTEEPEIISSNNKNEYYSGGNSNMQRPKSYSYGESPSYSESGSKSKSYSDSNMSKPSLYSQPEYNTNSSSGYKEVGSPRRGTPNGIKENEFTIPMSVSHMEPVRPVSPVSYPTPAVAVEAAVPHPARLVTPRMTPYVGDKGALPIGAPTGVTPSTFDPMPARPVIHGHGVGAHVEPHSHLMGGIHGHYGEVSHAHMENPYGEVFADSTLNPYPQTFHASGNLRRNITTVHGHLPPPAVVPGLGIGADVGVTPVAHPIKGPLGRLHPLARSVNGALTDAINVDPTVPHGHGPSVIPGHTHIPAHGHLHTHNLVHGHVGHVGHHLHSPMIVNSAHTDSYYDDVGLDSSPYYEDEVSENVTEPSEGETVSESSTTTSTDSSNKETDTKTTTSHHKKIRDLESEIQNKLKSTDPSSKLKVVLFNKKNKKPKDVIITNEIEHIHYLIHQKNYKRAEKYLRELLAILDNRETLKKSLSEDNTAYAKIQEAIKTYPKNVKSKNAKNLLIALKMKVKNTLDELNNLTSSLSHNIDSLKVSPLKKNTPSNNDDEVTTKTVKRTKRLIPLNKKR